MRQIILINPYLNLLPNWVVAFNCIAAAGIITLNVLLHELLKIVSIQNISQLIDGFGKFCSVIAITFLEHLGHITSVCLDIHFMAMNIVSQL